MASIQIPQVSQGLVITVSSGGYNMTGLTAELLLSLEESGGAPVVVTLPLAVQTGGLSGSYATIGTEFSRTGFYDAELKVFNGAGLLLYSLNSPQAVYVYPVFA